MGQHGVPQQQQNNAAVRGPSQPMRMHAGNSRYNCNTNSSSSTNREECSLTSKFLPNSHPSSRSKLLQLLPRHPSKYNNSRLNHNKLLTKPAVTSSPLKPYLKLLHRNKSKCLENVSTH